MEKKPKPQSSLNDEDYLEWAHNELARASDRLNEWRDQASECYDFYANSQWREEDRYELEEERGQPTVTFNRATRTINAVHGVEVQNRREIKFFPKKMGASGVSEYGTNAVRAIREDTDAEHEESEQFLDMLICGMGWTHTILDADEPETQVKINRFDPLEALWDPMARKKNLVDTKWRCRVKKMAKDEILSHWPDADLGVATKTRKYLDYSAEPHDASPPFYDETKAPGRQDDEPGYEVVYMEWWEYEHYYQLQTEEGSLVEFSPEKWKVVKEYAETRGLQWAKRRRKAYYYAVFTGMALLERGNAISQDSFCLQAITGLRNRNANTWFGLMTLMLDPQRWANKWLTQILHISNANAKGGLLAEVDAFENIQQAEDTWSSSDSITWLKPGGLGKIQEKTFGQIPAGLDRMLQYAMDAISSVSGVNVEMMGLADRDQPGVLEESRKRAGITIVAMFFDAQRLYHKIMGRLLMGVIRDYIADGRLVRMIGPQGARYVPLIKDELVMEYDIIVDDAPSSPSVKDKTFGALMQILPLALQAGIQVPPQVLEYMPLPDDLIQKWQEMLQPQQPNPEQEARKKLEFDTAQAAVEEIRSKAAVNMSQAQSKTRELDLKDQELKIKAAQFGFEAQSDKIRREHESWIKEQELQIAKIKLEMEAAQRGFDAQMKKQEQEIELACIERKCTHDREMKRLERMEPIEVAAESGEGMSYQDMVGRILKNGELIEHLVSALTDVRTMAMKPRKRVLVRDDKGRATHAIDTLMDDDEIPMRVN